MHINVRTTRPELSFHVQRKRVCHDRTTPVVMDSVVRGHIRDKSLVIENAIIPAPENTEE